jgi:pilus assembly protein Flp/PilA
VPKVTEIDTPFVIWIQGLSQVFSPYIGVMKAMIRKFVADESGATAIEYGLIAAGIALAIMAVVNGLGTKLNTKITAINSSLK